MILHSQDKPFKCTYCEEHFKSRFARLKHQEKFHLGKRSGLRDHLCLCLISGGRRVCGRRLRPAIGEGFVGAQDGALWFGEELIFQGAINRVYLESSVIFGEFSP